METFSRFFSAFASKVSKITGNPVTFVIASLLVVVWAASGPFFDYSDVWQLVINTSTTIITFLMIFVLQNSQNRDGKAIQAKLDELILTSEAHDKFIGVENLDDKALAKLKKTLESNAERIEESEVEAEIQLEGVRKVRTSKKPRPVSVRENGKTRENQRARVRK